MRGPIVKPGKYSATLYLVEKGLTTKLSEKKSFNVITLDVRETQKRAIEIYEQNGFIKFGENPFYATVSKKFVKGYYYYKQL